MVKRVLVTAGKVVAAIGVLFVSALVLSTLPDCAKLRAMVVNGSTSELEDVTLSIRDRVVWSGRFRAREERCIPIAEGGEGVFVLKGRYARSGMWFGGVSDYVTDYDQRIHLFLIKDDGVHAGEWHDPPWPSSEEMTVVDYVRVFGALFLDVMSCADYDLSTGAWRRW